MSNTDAVRAAQDGIREAILGAWEGSLSTQQYVEDDTKCPDINRFTTRLLTDHLGGHEAERSNVT